MAESGRGRTLIVGDIHGCIEELEELLAVVGFGRSDQLVSVGDLVHKGPASEAVLAFFVEGGHRAVLGNHDASMLRSLRTGRSTPDLERAVGRLGRERLQTWLEGLPLWLRLGSAEARCLVVHAGLDPRHQRVEEMDPRVLLTLRGWDHRTNAPGTWEDQPWFELCPPEHEPGQRIVFGHWAQRGLVRWSRFIGLDSGCCYGGRLSGYLVEEDRIVSVPSRQPRLFG